MTSGHLASGDRGDTIHLKFHPDFDVIKKKPKKRIISSYY